MAQKSGRRLCTEVLPLQSFTRAEDYHQKYLLKQRSDLVKELSRIYPLKKDFTDSTAVARLNGYAGGYGNPVQLEREIDDLGLSRESRKTLIDLVNNSKRGLFN